MDTHGRALTLWARWSNDVIGVLILVGGATAHGLPPGWGIAWVAYVLARFTVNERRTAIVIATIPGQEEPVPLQVMRPATACQATVTWAAPACVLLIDWSDLLVGVLR